MQIGPRIRVGGSLGKFGQKAKIGIGKLAQPVGKVVSFVNPLLGTAISTAGDVLDTSDGKFDVWRAAKNGALQYGAPKLAGKLSPLLRKIPGISAAEAAMSDKLGLPSGTSNADVGDGPPVQIGTNPDGSPRYNPGQEPDRYRPITPASSSKSHGFMDDIGGFLSAHKNDILDYGAAAEGLYDKYRRNKQQDEVMKLGKADYERRAPLRDAGMKALLDDSTPDTSAIFNDPYAPTGRYRKVFIGSRGY